MAPSPPRLCYITDRHALAPRPLLPLLSEAIEAGVELAQIRERDLATGDLLRLVEAAVGAVRQLETRAVAPRVIVNDRLDVALAAGADGVHLGGR